MFRRRFGLRFTFCIMHLTLPYIWHALPVDAINDSLMCGRFRGALSLAPCCCTTHGSCSFR
ncbi:hypothetical protein PMIN01_00819 [Paraphaeosphaeria minitans]|uniref:Secreted protein n=1 Tax=Paraphaeosphaeria minitans TaxID=565426 RepID=A0A9P6KWC9_9PLEO|nr:hypothetical protein PMIN01_00819 [Paraphaeosphaeria minitans]